MTEHTTPETTDPAQPAQAGTLPLALTHAQMNAAYDTGEAAALASAVTWLTRYRDTWWVVYERGWLRITDTPTITDIDQAATRLTQAETNATRSARTLDSPFKGT